MKNTLYFSMEYAFHPDLKTYAGGLGILAGDHLKGAKRFGYPITGIGIKWKQGYGEQYISPNGDQSVSYTNNNYSPYIEDTGKMVDVEIRNRKVFCKIYRVKTEDVDNLYLLDTDHNLNDGADRWICGQLYGWFAEERLAQEIILGVGGVKAAKVLGLKPEVYHFNEGHAVLAGLELLKNEINAGASFESALEAVRKVTVFTTHTPIVQGNESHNIETMIYTGANHGFSIAELTALGGSPFNMTVAALRLAGKSNAVSQLHQKTAEKMWQNVENRSAIIGITNGICTKTWCDQRMMDSVDKTETLSKCHAENKRVLLDCVEERTGKRLDPKTLLIAFSRRAVAYKRSALIFSKPEIIKPLLKEKKIQLVFAGKPHPLDDGGKEIIQTLLEYQSEFPDNVVFIPNYDMTLGRNLTRGADVWLNNPRIPLEACGTSGMKAAMNGVLNLSTLDGWFPEFVKHGQNGWQFGDGKTIDDVSDLKELDAHDVQCLYDILLHQVIPTFYDQPQQWLKLMQNSIRDAAQQFSVQNMLEQYSKLLYS